MHDEAIEKLDKLVRSFDTAMLVTRSLEGELRARPMAIADRDEAATLYFVTRAENEKLEEILADPQVAVTLQSEDRYLSISGEARVLTDQNLTDELWSATMRIWFPEGSSDPELTVIVVDPDYAEYWNREGMRRLEFLWEAGKALLRGEQPADDDLAGHEKIKL